MYKVFVSWLDPFLLSGCMCRSIELSDANLFIPGARSYII